MVDRIRKALDLARMQRAQGEPLARLDRGAVAELAVELEQELPGPALPEEHHAAPVDGAPPDHKAAKSQALRPLASIVYSRTRVFAPAAEHLERNRILNPAASEAAAAAYRMLRTQVLQRMDAHGWRSLAIFSARAEDGKTTTAINLAASVASDHLHTVLLVEFDLRRPRLAAHFGFSPQYGVDDALHERASLEQCLHHPEGFDRLVLLPARARLGNSSEILAGPKSRELVASLRFRYPERVIIYDLPPVLNADDALSFAPLVECGLVVAAEGRTRRDDLRRTIELLNKTPLVGTVLNRAADAPPGY